MARHSSPIFSVNEDASQVIISSDSPFSCLSHPLDPLFLEHFYEVLLDACLNHFSRLFRFAVNNWLLISCLLSIILEESLPVLLLGEVEIHQDRVV